MSDIRALLAAVGLVLLGAFAVVAFEAPLASAAESRDFDAGHDSGVQQDQSDDGDDNRVEIMVWTVFAAALALCIGLLLFLFRLIMGWVKAPPAPQEDHH
jgi:hypothetical protein